MSLIRDAIEAMKKVLLLEERITSQSRKVEQLANQMVAMERRLATMEGQLQGFFAGAAAFRMDSPPLIVNDTKSELNSPRRHEDRK